MLRRASFVLIVLAAMGLMQHRLSDGERHPAWPPPPVLWESANHPISAPPPPGPCVLVIPLDLGGTFMLTSPENGVDFDLDADSSRERVSWTEPGAEVAWLAVDRNGDGRIISGRELVGDRMLPQARTAPEALITFASERRPAERSAFLNTNNSQFSQLLLWTDRNHNGISEEAELRSAGQLLAQIALGFERNHRKDGHGNESRYRGSVYVRRAAGVDPVSTPADDRARLRWMYDACLVAR